MWTDFNAGNACVPGTVMYELYSKEVGICQNMGRGQTTYTRVPYEIMQLQGNVMAGMAFGVATMVFTLCHHFSELKLIGLFATMMSIVTCSALWSSISNWQHSVIANKYRTGDGFYIPLLASPANVSNLAEKNFVLEKYLLSFNNPMYHLLVASSIATTVASVTIAGYVYYLHFMKTQTMYENINSDRHSASVVDQL